MYYNDKIISGKDIAECFKISNTPVEKPKLIYDIIK